MKFKVDENMPVETAEVLCRAGHDASTILDEHMGGAPDSDIAKMCQTEARALLTLDAGFGDIRRYPPKQHCGLIVLRLQQRDRAQTLEVVKRLLPELEEDSLNGQLWIVEEWQIRIRS